MTTRPGSTDRPQLRRRPAIVAVVVVALLASLLGLASPANAWIDDVSGDTLHVQPGIGDGGVTNTGAGSWNKAWAFGEIEDKTLDGAVSVNCRIVPGGGEFTIDSSADYTNSNCNSRWIQEGWSIDSHLLHSRVPTGTPSASNCGEFQSTEDGSFCVYRGTVTFGNPIIGIIGDSSRLSETDRFFSDGDTSYPTGDPGRGMEWPNNPEWIKISADRKTLEYKLATANKPDQIRVITDNNWCPVAGLDHRHVYAAEGEAVTNAGKLFDPNRQDVVSVRASIGSVSRNSFRDGKWSWSWTADDGTRTQDVTVTLEDRSGCTRSQTFTVHITDVPPTFAFYAPASATENSSFPISVSGLDDPSAVDRAAGYRVEFTCGRGGGFELADSLSRTCDTADDAPATPLVQNVEARVSSKNAAATSGRRIARDVSVSNVAPTAGLTAAAADEGGAVAVAFVTPSDASVTDRGVLEFRVRCGDAAYSAWSTSTTSSCDAPEGPASIAIAGQVRDDDNGVRTLQATGVVSNVSPTATFVVPAEPVEEGSTFDLALTDPFDPSPSDLAVLVYDFDCGSGVWTPNPASSSPSGQCTAGNGSAEVTVRGRIADDDGGAAPYSSTVDVVNVAPTARIVAPSDVDEGGSFQIGAVDVLDPADTAFTYALDCGDGGGPVESIDPTRSCTADDGPDERTVSLVVSDGESDSVTYTAQVKIHNVAPTGVPTIPGAADEGAMFQLALTAVTDPSKADRDRGFTYAFDCGSGYGTEQQQSSFTCTAGDGPATTAVGITVYDKDRGATEYRGSVVIGNVAPKGTLEAPETVTEASSFDLEISDLSDPSPTDLESLEAAFDCGLGAGLGAYSRSMTTACAALDDGPATQHVRAVLRDADGAETPFEADVVVTNVRPTGVFDVPTLAPEAGTFSIAIENGNDVSSADRAILEYSFDCGPGEPTAFSATTSVTCAALDDGHAGVTQEVQGWVRDDDGGISPFTATVNIENVAPTATPDAPDAVEEGDPITVSLADPADVSTTDTDRGFEYAFDCGGGYAPWGAATSATCTTDDDGPRIVKAKIRDKDHGETEYSRTVAVDSVAPVADWSVTTPVDEGSDILLRLDDPRDPSSVDTAAGFHYAFDCGLGAGLVDAASGIASCPTDDNGTRIVGGKLSDDDGDFSTYGPTEVEIRNVAPTATFVAPTAVDEGDDITLALTDTDDVSVVDERHGLRQEFSCDGGTTWGASSACATDDGPSTVEVHARISDKDGGVSTYRTVVNVLNVAPTGTFHAPRSVNETDTITLSLTDLVDPSDADTTDGLDVRFSCDGGATWSDVSTCPTTDDGVVDVAASVTDKDNGITIYSAAVEVTNVAPTIGTATTTGPAVACGSGNDVSLAFDVTDPATDNDDPITGTIDWGDGSTVTSFTGRSVVQSHQYEAGTYTITITAADGDGGVDTEILVSQVKVHYRGSMGNPISPDGTSVFNLKQSVPVKAMLVDCAGNLPKGIAPIVKVRHLDSGRDVTVVMSVGGANKDNIMRPSGQQYIYNLSTDSTFADGTTMVAGRYEVIVEHATIAPLRAEFSLK